MFKRKTFFFVLYSFFSDAFVLAQQIKRVYYGAIKTYYVDLDDGYNRIFRLFYEWSILERNSAKIICNGNNTIFIVGASNAPGNNMKQMFKTNESFVGLFIQKKANTILTASETTGYSFYSFINSTNINPLNSTFQYNWSYPTCSVVRENVSSLDVNFDLNDVEKVKDNHCCASNSAISNLIVNTLPSTSNVVKGQAKLCKSGSLGLKVLLGLSSYNRSRVGIVLDEKIRYDRILKVNFLENYIVATTDSHGRKNTFENSFFVDILLYRPTQFCYSNSS